MIQSKDQYVGEREPANKLRHGQGVYTYSNKYFQYEGQWVNGKKHGYGILRMNEPAGLQSSELSQNMPFCSNISQYEGEFRDGEITGKGVYMWANGNVYDGEFLEGEKHGQGTFTTPYEEYIGQWAYNQYSGKGVVKRNNGDLIEGEFLRHKMHGICKMNLSSGIVYEGELKNGLKDGNGNYQTDRYSYIGQYIQDQKSGKGKLQFKSGFDYDGEWKDNQPILISNRITIKEIKPILTEQEIQEQQDNALKNQKKPSEKQITDSNNLQQIEYEILGKPFTVEINSMYQPPQILDPNQPTEEEIEELIKNWQKDNKKNKNPPPMPDFKEPKMIYPEMQSVEFESGRNFKLQLIFELDPEKGKEAEPRQTKVFKLDYRQQMEQKRVEIEQIKKKLREEEEELEKEAQKETDKKGGKKPAKKDTKKGGKGAAQNEDEFKINLYNEEEPEENKNLVLRNTNGSLLIENLEFPEDFPPTLGGNYYIQVEDITQEKDKYGSVEPIRIDLIINPVGGSDPKKKKK